MNNSGEVTERVGRFERKIIFSPAFDRRHKDPKKNYGIHCSDIVFVLRDIVNIKAVSFTVFSGWHYDKKLPKLEPMGASIDLHTTKPQYEGHKRYPKICHYLGKKCYVDGSCMRAEKVFDILNKDGIEAMWKELERWMK